MFYIIGVNPNIERADRGLMEQIWIEKYRPNNLSEVVGQEAVTTRLKNYVKESSMPHLLFAGHAGIGKTTSALALAREMFGELWKHNLHELNASDERGIDVVRGKIKEFARTAPLGEKGFKGLSRLNHQSALNLREKILKISNIEILNTSFFNEFTLSLPINGETFIERMAEKRVLAGIPVSRLIKSNNKTDNLIVVASTETNTEEDINKYIEVANEVLK